MGFGYVIVETSVTDPQAAPPDTAGAKAGAVCDAILIGNARSAQFDGMAARSDRARNQFPKGETDLAWHRAEAYAPVKAVRQSASTSLQTIVEGL